MTSKELTEVFIMGIWYDPVFCLPKNDNDVLCIISGTIKNVTYDKAMVIGAYCEGDEAGWMFDTIVHADIEDYDNITVHYWAYLPKYPKCMEE